MTQIKELTPNEVDRFVDILANQTDRRALRWVRIDVGLYQLAYGNPYAPMEIYCYINVQNQTVIIGDLVKVVSKRVMDKITSSILNYLEKEEAEAAAQATQYVRNYIELNTKELMDK